MHDPKLLNEEEFRERRCVLLGQGRRPSKRWPRSSARDPTASLSDQCDRVDVRVRELHDELHGGGDRREDSVREGKGEKSGGHGLGVRRVGLVEASPWEDHAWKS